MPKKSSQASLVGPWTDRINPPLDEIDAIIEKYGFHELDREAILESNQYARIDTYEDYLFLVLHFPKYEPHTERYIQNELNIFIAKDYLITFRYYQSTTMKRIYDRYEERLEKNIWTEPAFLLYEILEGFLDKTMKMLERFARDLKALEYELFTARGTDTIRNIMTRKRNIITLKHMMKPQIAVLKLIELRMKERFSEEVEFYFENLEDKLDKIFSEIQLLQENIDSMEDTLKSIFELDTNTTIKYLTVFSAFMLPLTLATSFFGMNVESGHFDNWIIYISLILVTVIFIGIAYIFIKKRII
jgi:magnesium transporter